MERGVGGQRADRTKRGKESVVTVNELLERIADIGTTGEEPVVFEPTIIGEYQEVRRVFRDHGQIVLSNCGAE